MVKDKVNRLSIRELEVLVFKPLVGPLLVSKVQTFCGWNPTPAPTKQAGFKLLSSLFYQLITSKLSYSVIRIYP